MSWSDGLPIDARTLSDMADLAADALLRAAGSLASSDDALPLDVLERAGEVGMGHRRLSATADGLLATGPLSDEVRSVVDALTVSALLDEIGQAAVRVAAAGANASPAPVPPDTVPLNTVPLNTDVTGCLADMGGLAARMVRDAVAGFLEGRADGAAELRFPVCQVAAGHRHVRQATAGYAHPFGAWALSAVEMAQELEAAASLAVAIAERATGHVSPLS